MDQDLRYRIERLEALVDLVSRQRAAANLDGLMSLTDKAKLDGATNNAFANTLVLRDGSGNFSGNVIGANTVTATTLVGALTGDATTAGAFSAGAAKTKFDALGSTLSSYRTTNLPVAAGVPTQFISLALPQGIWLVQFSVAVNVPGAAAAYVDCYEPTVGFNGSFVVPAGGNLVWQSALMVFVAGAGGLTVTGRTYSLTAHTVTAAGGVGGFGNASGVRAVRVG